MSAFSISYAEKKLLSHLQLGGDPLDKVGKELTAKFVYTALKDKNVSAIAIKYKITMEDICLIYSTMIIHLMPNPCIIAGGLLLVPTLFFMEPMRFEGLASNIAAHTDGLSEMERKQVIVGLAEKAAQQTWDAHTAARGEAPFKRQSGEGLQSSCGCLGLITFIFAIASVILIGISA